MTATIAPPETACERTLELPALELQAVRVSYTAWAVIGRSGHWPVNPVSHKLHRRRLSLSGWFRSLLAAHATPVWPKGEVS